MSVSTCFLIIYFMKKKEKADSKELNWYDKSKGACVLYEGIEQGPPVHSDAFSTILVSLE